MTQIIPGGITCQEVVEIVTDYIEGKLAPADVQKLEEHLKLCGPCAEYIEQVRTTARLAAAARLEVHPDREALLNAFRAYRSQR
jgi:predicted anti-sigma-YlaC factor YlaD